MSASTAGVLRERFDWMRNSASPIASKLAEAGGPMRPGDAVASSPGDSSKINVSMPRSSPETC